MRGSVPQRCDLNYSYPEAGIVIWNRIQVSNRGGSIFLICDQSDLEAGFHFGTGIDRKDRIKHLDLRHWLLPLAHFEHHGQFLVACIFSLLHNTPHSKAFKRIPFFTPVPGDIPRNRGGDRASHQGFGL